jgi:hypothetical protein
MTKTMRVLGLATALVTGVAGTTFAAGGSLGSQNTTQEQLGAGGQNQMLAQPANPGAQAVPGATVMNGGTTTQTYNGAVNSPTTPDANNPTTATSPSGGGGGSGGGAGR